jgi:hypothetical protein
MLSNPEGVAELRGLLDEMAADMPPVPGWLVGEEGEEGGYGGEYGEDPYDSDDEEPYDPWEDVFSTMQVRPLSCCSLPVLLFLLGVSKRCVPLLSSLS